jgi:hypothetical protein
MQNAVKNKTRAVKMTASKACSFAGFKMASKQASMYALPTSMLKVFGVEGHTTHE